MQPVASALAAPTKQKSSGDALTASHVARMKGFSHATGVGQCSNIWLDWELTNNIDMNREKLWEYMHAWSKNTKYEIDESLHFDDDVMKQLIAMQDCMGATVPRLGNIEKGNGILACAFRSLDDSENAQELDDLARSTEGNRTVAEEEKIKKRKTRAPPQDFEELKKCIATFAATNFARWGVNCPFYLELLRMRQALDNRFVQTARMKFTAQRCRQIIWAIHEAMVDFFSHKCTPNDFAEGADTPWPETDGFEDVYKCIRYGTPIKRDYFPTEWITRTPGQRVGAGSSASQRSNGGGGASSGGSGGFLDNFMAQGQQQQQQSQGRPHPDNALSGNGRVGGG